MIASICLHVERSNYQAAIWQHCLETFSRVPNPADGHGWSVDNDDLTVQWMSGSLAPDMVLNFMSSNGKRDFQWSSCQCVSNGLKCTDACFLKDCSNVQEDEDLEQDSDEEKYSDSF